MNQEEYKKLNKYLNDICLYLEKQDNFFLENIISICSYNDRFYFALEKYDLALSPKTNNLTFQDVYNLAREIIESINPKYLDDFDKLIETGALDFSYNDEYNGSYFYHEQQNSNTYNYININRKFNYDDVRILVHEVIHYINGKNNISKNRHVLTEFLSIYFEIYAIDYMMKKGIPKEEIDYLCRLRWTYFSVCDFYMMESPFICYLKFGDVSNQSLEMLNKYYFKLSKKAFDYEKMNLLYYFEDIDKPDNISLKCGKQFSLHCQYLLGTIFAFFARSYCDIEKIIYLNDHINDENGYNVCDWLKKIGINLDNDTLDKSLNCIQNYLDYYKTKQR